MKKCFSILALASALCLSLTVSVGAANQAGGDPQMNVTLPPGTITSYTTSFTVDFHSDYKEEVTIDKEYHRMFIDPINISIINVIGYQNKNEETITCPIDKLEETIDLEHIKNLAGEVFDGLSLSVLKLQNGDSWDIVYKLQQNKAFPDNYTFSFKILNSADRIYELGETNLLSAVMGNDIFHSDYVDFSCHVSMGDDKMIPSLTFMSSPDGGAANYDKIKDFVGFDFNSNKKLIGDLIIQMHDCVDLEKGAWYENAIIYCSAAGYVKGYDNGKFGPNDSITFAQLATILSHCPEEYEYYQYNVDHWAKDAMGFAVRNSIFISSDVLTNGKPDVSKWDKPMTREQAVYSIAQYVQFVHWNTENNAVDIPDINSVDAKYLDGVKLAYQYGITSGVDAKGTFLPKSPVTRAQICQMIYNNRL